MARLARSLASLKSFEPDLIGSQGTSMGWDLAYLLESVILVEDRPKWLASAEEHDLADVGPAFVCRHEVVSRDVSNNLSNLIGLYMYNRGWVILTCTSYFPS